MSLNNIYNFKNPVKHFLDVEGLAFPVTTVGIDINKLCWTEPIKFRVRKTDDKFRTLKMPNILNLVCAYEHFKDMPDFFSVQDMDHRHKRLVANVETGDFASGEYDRQLEQDFENLCVYDNLLKLDIKEYYGRIYTHKIDFAGHTENFLSNMNAGATNGLLMGNYLSLYFAERHLSQISADIETALEDKSIDCIFSYFSDDFYFFCNRSDNADIIRIFDKVLEQYDLERKEEKQIWDYESFNGRNVAARHWKKLVAQSNMRFKDSRNNNSLHFINQIVYRMSELEDEKLKRVFINNVFKLKFFRELSLGKYQVKEYDYHQLCFLMKFSPEAMLYLADRFSKMAQFNNDKLRKFFATRYRASLKEAFSDEQLYYYYAIKMFRLKDILKAERDLVSKSENQILISYYLKDQMFDENNLRYLKSLDEECYWFQNYHMILHRRELMSDLENSINAYLIPKSAKKPKQKETYMAFYKDNLEQRIDIIRSIPNVKKEIIAYLNLRYAETEEATEEDDD